MGIKGHFFFLVCGLAVAITAQRSVVLPPQYEKTWSAAMYTSSGLGANSSGIVQTHYPSPFPTANSVLFGVGFRRSGNTNDYAAFTADVELVASSTGAKFSSLSTTFAANLGKDATTIFPKKKIHVPGFSANVSPANWIDFPAVKPWPLGGPHLLVQMKVFSKITNTAGSIFKMERNFKLAGSGDYEFFGRGCGSANIGISASTFLPGSSFVLQLVGAPANSGALAFLDFDLTRMICNIPLPFDLTCLGMTGCMLLVSPRFNFPARTDAQGNATITFPIPGDPSLAMLGLGLQWLHADSLATNPAKMSVTAGVALRIGPIVPTNSYLWDISNVAATTGILMEGGPIMRTKVLP